MSELVALVIAAVAGVSMAVQGSLNSVLGKVIGRLEATLIVHTIGAAVLALMIYLLQLGGGDLGKMGEAPWYSYLGGLISVIIIYAVVASIPRVGVANATTAIIVGQVITASAIDHLGLWGLEAVPFSWWKGVGMLFLAIGTRLMLMRG